MLKHLLLIAYSRSGATLLCRMLGATQSVVHISEVNPAWGIARDHKSLPSIDALSDQAKHWHDIDITADTFQGAIEQVIDWAEREGKFAAFRDWSRVDFHASVENNFSPSGKLAFLSPENRNDKLRPVALVRNAIDVYLSSDTPLEQFASEYLQYAREVANSEAKIIYYEDLVRHPKRVLADIFNLVNHQTSKHVSEFSNFYNVTGDIQHGRRSRGFDLPHPEILARKWTPTKRMARILNCKELQEANLILGYANRSDPTEYESFLGALSRKAAGYNVFQIRSSKLKIC